MTETSEPQHVPVKMFRSLDRLTIAAPMAGVQPEDIQVEVTDSRRVVLQAQLRGTLKDIKELLLDEWSVGDYYRDVELTDAVDGEHANVTYGNGVLVVVLPIVEKTVPATLTIEKTAKDFGEYAGNSGHGQVE